MPFCSAEWPARAMIPSITDRKSEREGKGVDYRRVLFRSHLLRITLERRHGGGDILVKRDALLLGRMAGQSDDSINQPVGMDRLEFRLPRTREVEQIGQQPIQALNLFADDGERCLPHLLGGLLRFNQIRSPVDARQRISDFVRKARRQLAYGGQPVGSFDLLEAVLELAIQCREFTPLPHPLIGEHTGDGAHQKEHDDLRVLVHGVVEHVVPSMQNVRNVADGGGCGCDKAATPAEVDRGVNDREVVQALEEVMPEDEAGRREIVERRGYCDAGGHHDDSRKWFWLLHFFVLLPHVLDHSAIWKALSSMLCPMGRSPTSRRGSARVRGCYAGVRRFAEDVPYFEHVVHLALI